MNKQIHAEKHVQLSWVLKLVALELIAITLSVIAVVGIALVFVYASDYIYNLNHAIPDPVARGEDLGLGLVVVASAMGSLFLSIPCSIFIHLYLFRRFGRRPGHH